MVTSLLDCARPERASGNAARPAAIPASRRNCLRDGGLLDICLDIAVASHVDLRLALYHAEGAMRRRDFIKAIAGSAAAWPLPARAQKPDRVRRIGWLSAGAGPGVFTRSFLDAMRERGYA